MTQISDFRPDPRRDAWATIHGFLYQIQLLKAATSGAAKISPVGVLVADRRPGLHGEVVVQALPAL